MYALRGVPAAAFDDDASLSCLLGRGRNDRRRVQTKERTSSVCWPINFDEGLFKTILMNIMINNTISRGFIYGSLILDQNIPQSYLSSPPLLRLRLRLPNEVGHTVRSGSVLMRCIIVILV